MRYSLFLFTFLISCQSTEKIAHKKREIPLEVNDILSNFNSMPKAIQKKALENSWVYFTYAFQFAKFQQDLLKEFPSLNVFGIKPALIGRTPLDLRLLNKVDANPIALLLAIDLEMELLSRFHSNQQTAPKCLEDFWIEWNLPLPRTQLSNTQVSTPRNLSKTNPIEASATTALNESSSRLALYLKQSLALPPETPLKLIGFEDAVRAQFSVQENATDAETYEIFSAPIDCKALQEKKFAIPLLGKMRCLQKQSATWITVSSKESTVLSDNWGSEVKQRCQKWERPLSDMLKKDSAQIRSSALSRSWSLYPRIRNFINTEASRYELSFRQALDN
jgi:hypothetical protein